jgi:hypothetical protein
MNVQFGCWRISRTPRSPSERKSTEPWSKFVPTISISPASTSTNTSRIVALTLLVCASAGLELDKAIRRLARITPADLSSLRYIALPSSRSDQQMLKESPSGIRE